MIKLPPTLLGLSLALALAAMPADAQQITTSQGVRTLPRTDSMKTEAELRQVLNSSELVLAEVLRDFEAAEKAYSTVSGDAAAFPEQIKSVSADYERARLAFVDVDQAYRDSLAAYEQRLAAQEADIQRQRAAAAPVEALPSAQRDINEVFRLNEWSERLGKEREAIKVEGDRLLTEHARVEAERAKLESQRLQSDAALKKKRETLVGGAGDVQERRKRTQEQLRTTVAYVEKVRLQLNAITANDVPRSQLLERATLKAQASAR